MMNNPLPIQDFLQPGKRVHLVGIGGVSMCPLAEVLRGMGLQVQGSDMSDGPSVQRLKSLGIPVSQGHSAENLVALAEQLKSIEGETRVVMEHTGRYYESVRCAP